MYTMHHKLYSVNHHLWKGSRSGADAVIALMELKPDDEPIVIAFNANKIKRIPLNFCIEQMKKQKEAISANNNDLLIKLRGR